MKIKIFNTMSREKEEFQPLVPGEVGIYSCGPTVYSKAHIGNMKAYLFADLLKRMFQFNNFKVKHVMNITDVGHLTSDADTGEDKMEKGARRDKMTVWEIAEKYTSLFKQDIAKLNIIEPSIWCKATDYIKEQIELIQEIEKNGFTYQIEDGIYFDTSKVEDYGKLARLKIEGLKQGARVATVEGKKHPTDFALWKFSPKGKKRQMEWDSPWGVGFPGWHIECNAMSMKLLGDEFDIHTGGMDLMQIHHTNEIAQAKAAGKKFARYWMHSEFLVISSGKMAKSEGQTYYLDSLKQEGIQPLDYRYFCLNTHYRKQLLFSMEALQAAKNALNKLQETVASLKAEDKAGENSTEYENKFHEAVNDDLNIPKALGFMWDLINDKTIASKEKLKSLLLFDKILGLDFEKIEPIKQKTLELEGIKIIVMGDIEEEIIQLAKNRELARKEKNWELSDKLRDEILEKGCLIEDTPEGTRLRKK